MNAVMPPRQPDDLDRLLTAFYQSEMPRSWPTPKLPTVGSVKPSQIQASESKPRISTSQVTLAASVAVLVTACWFVSGRLGVETTNPANSTELSGGDVATRINPMLPLPTKSRSPARP